MKFLVFDGNSIINRAFYAIRMLTTSDGRHTNAVYGFLNIYFKLMDEQKPDYVCVAFDLPGQNFRHELFDMYKAKRKQMPFELCEQMDTIKEVLAALGISFITKEGYEADDIIGTISKKCSESDIECFIVTGDRDELQLVDEKVKVLYVSTKMGQNTTVVYDEPEVKNKYNLSPGQLIDLKALMGDQSDNIPGVAGIGEKTALLLMQKYQSLDNIYDNLDSLDERPGLIKKLKDGKDAAFLSRKLGKIDRGVPIEFNIDSFLVKPEYTPKAYDVFNKLEFKTLISKLGLEPDKQTDIVPEIKNVKKDAFQKLFKSIKEKGAFKYILLDDGLLFNIKGGIYCADISDLDAFKDIFEDKEILKISYNLKRDMVYLLKKGIEFNGLGFDFCVAAYVCDPFIAQNGFSAITKRFLNNNSALFDSIISSKEGAALSLSVMDEIRDLMDKAFKQNDQRYLFYEVELPLTKVLADMETKGVYVDKEQLREVGESLLCDISKLENEIHKIAGDEFNISSPKQLGVVLFEKLGLPVVKKTKTGYSTDAAVLEKLMPYNPIIEKVILYRQMTKLKSTYIDGFINVINKDTNRVHTSFNQTITMTGRLSSTEPNLQNIPIRLDLGRQIRKAFKSTEGFIFICADYSQIDLRVLAHISDDENMIAAFNENKDIHAVTASQVFSVPLEQVTTQMRNSAKAVNFGIVYGISEFSLANNLGIWKNQAKEYMQSYFKVYHGVRQYMDNIKKSAKRDGFVKTLFNRIRYIPELKNSNFNIRSFGERVALNTPIQGTSSDIIKIAMVNIYKRLNENKLKSKLVLQVHDELIIEAAIEEAEVVEGILKTEMEAAAKLSVPLTVSISKGITWYDTK